MNNKNPSWWRIFALEYLKNCENATAAYHKVKPHVSTTSAAAESSLLLRNPKFLKVLDQEQQYLNKLIDIGVEGWTNELLWVAMQRPEEMNMGNKLRALELVGKAKGFLSDRVDVTSAGKSLDDSFVSAIAKLREDPNRPRLTEDDLKAVLEAEIVD